MSRPSRARYGVDANGNPTERIRADGRTIVVHHQDIPESDITTVRGMRATTPVRTIIDLAMELEPDDLRRAVDDSIERGLFTREEMAARLDRPDMVGRHGAERVRALLGEASRRPPT